MSALARAIREIVEVGQEQGFFSFDDLTDLAELAEREDRENKKRIVDLESQLGIALEIMFDSQIAEFQHLFENKLDIGDSASTNQTEGER